MYILDESEVLLVSGGSGDGKVLPTIGHISNLITVGQAVNAVANWVSDALANENAERNARQGTLYSGGQVDVNGTSPTTGAGPGYGGYGGNVTGAGGINGSNAVSANGSIGPA